MEFEYSASGVKASLQIEDAQLLRKALLNLRNKLSKTDDLVPFAPVLTNNGLDLLFSAWHRCFRDRSDALSATPPSLTAQILQSLERNLERKPLGLLVIDRIIDQNMRNLHNNLASGKHDLILATLKLLNIMVRYDRGARCKRLMDNFDWELKGAGKLLSMRRRNEQSLLLVKPDIRTLTILFITGFYQGSLYTKKEMLDKGSSLLPLILRGLKDDHSQVVDYFLATLWHDLYEDRSLSRTLTLRILDRKSLASLVSLYKRRDEARVVVHKFLDRICRPVFGIGFRAHGMYDCDSLKDDPESQDSALNSAPANWRILQIVDNLCPSEDSLQRKLLLQLLRRFPDLRYHYLRSCRLSIEPRLSSQWLITMSLCADILNLHIPEFLHGTNEGFHVLPPPVAKLCELCVPSLLNSHAMSKALLSSHSLVRFTALMVLAACLNSAAKVRAIVKQGSATLGQGWVKTWREIETVLSFRLPEFNTLVNAKQGADQIQSPLFEETRLRCIALYLRLIPRSSAQSFGSGRLFSMLADQTPASPESIQHITTLAQIHTLEIISLDPSFKVDGKATLLPYGNLTALIVTYLESKGFLLRSSLKRIIENLAIQSLAFECAEPNIGIWLRALEALPAESRPEVLTFFDQCLERFHKAPFKYLDVLQTLLTESRALLQSRYVKLAVADPGSYAEIAIDLQTLLYDGALTASAPVMSPLIMTCLEQMAIKQHKGLISDEVYWQIHRVISALLESMRTHLPSDDVLTVLNGKCDGISRQAMSKDLILDSEAAWTDLTHAILESAKQGTPMLEEVLTYGGAVYLKEQPNGFHRMVVGSIFAQSLHCGHFRLARITSALASRSEPGTSNSLLLAELLDRLPEQLSVEVLQHEILQNLAPAFSKKHFEQVWGLITSANGSENISEMVVALSRRLRTLLVNSDDHAMHRYAIEILLPLTIKCPSTLDVLTEVHNIIELVRFVKETSSLPAIEAQGAITLDHILAAHSRGHLQSQEVLFEVLPELLLLTAHGRDKYSDDITKIILAHGSDLRLCVPLIETAQEIYGGGSLRGMFSDSQFVDALMSIALGRETITMELQQSLLKILSHESVVREDVVSRLDGALQMQDSILPPTALKIELMARSSNKIWHAFVHLTLGWLVRRFAEDETVHSETANACVLLGLRLSGSAKMPISAAIAEPVITAAIQNHLNSPAALEICKILCHCLETRPGLSTRLLQLLLYSASLREFVKDPSLRNHIVELLHAVYFKDPEAVSQLWIVTALVELYEGTLSRPDLLLRDCLIAYEKHAGTSSLPEMLLWGANGRSMRYAIGSDLNSRDVLGSLDPAKMLVTLFNFHLQSPNRKAAIKAAGESVYDARFLGSLLDALILLSQDRGLQWPEVIRSQLLSIMVLQLSTTGAGNADQALATLQICYSKIEESVFPEQPHVLLVLDLLRDCISTDGSSAPKLSGPLAYFIAQSLQATVQPASAMYTRYMRYLLQRSMLKKDEIPLLLSTLWSREESARRDRIWQLRSLKNGLLSDSDLSIYKRQKTFQTVLTLYTAPVCDNAQRTLILQLLAHAASYRAFADYLVGRLGIFAWLAAALRLEKDSTPASTSSLLRIGLSVLRNVHLSRKDSPQTQGIIHQVIKLFDTALSRIGVTGEEAFADNLLLITTILRSLLLRNRLAPRQGQRLLKESMRRLLTYTQVETRQVQVPEAYLAWLKGSDRPDYLLSDVLTMSTCGSQIIDMLHTSLLETMLLLPATKQNSADFRYLMRQKLTTGRLWLSQQRRDIRRSRSTIHDGDF